MKYFILGATLVASYALNAMNHTGKSVLMPMIRMTEEATDLLEDSRCSKNQVCSYSRNDETLLYKRREQIKLLRNIFRKNINSQEITIADIESISGDLHIVLSWLFLLQGKKRDTAVTQLVAVNVYEKRQNRLEALERHGFRANRLPASTFKALEDAASRHQSGSFSRYIFSLKNPREFNIEECVNQ